MAKHSIEYDRQDFKSVTLYMLRLFGADILRESNRIYAIFYDLSPNLKPYSNVMRQLAERGVLADLFAALHDDGIYQDRAMMKAQYVLENELLLGSERVDYFLDILRTICGTRIIKRGECGDNVTYTLNQNGVLTIIPLQDIQIYLPGFNQEPMPMWNFGGDNDTAPFGDIPWINEREMISHVEIQAGVTSIGAYVFESCQNLTSVYIPDSVTSIEDGAFKDCTGLKCVTIPDSVTYIGGWAFDCCAGLTSVIIPNSVIHIGKLAFKGCKALASVSVPSKGKIEDDAFPDSVIVTRRT